MGSALIVQRDGSVTKSEWLIIFVPEYAWLDIFVLKVSAIYYLALYECNLFIFVLLCCTLYCYAMLRHAVLYCSVLTLVYCTVLYGLWCTALCVTLSISIPSSSYLTSFLSCLVLSSFLLSSFSWLSPRKHLTHTDVVW